MFIFFHHFSDYKKCSLQKGALKFKPLFVLKDASDFKLLTLNDASDFKLFTYEIKMLFELFLWNIYTQGIKIHAFETLELTRQLLQV